jgi:hypothetical protein
VAVAHRWGRDVAHPKNTETSFWKKVSTGTQDECWNWRGAKDKDGYGKYRLYDKHMRAHRIAYGFNHGIPDGMLVLHRCDNPACVNPSHLFLGDQQRNIDDCKSKGRWPVGEKNHNAKLTNEQAKYARHLYFAERHTVKALADFFGVSTYALHQIVIGRRYRSDKCLPAT